MIAVAGLSIVVVSCSPFMVIPIGMTGLKRKRRAQANKVKRRHLGAVIDRVGHHAREKHHAVRA
jgi:hypothetical protein